MKIVGWVAVAYLVVVGINNLSPSTLMSMGASNLPDPGTMVGSGTTGAIVDFALAGAVFYFIVK